MFYKKNFFYDVLFSICKLFQHIFSLKNTVVVHYVYHDDIKRVFFDDGFTIVLNQLGYSRLKNNLNLYSKSSVSIIYVNEKNEMCKLAVVPDISFILFGNQLTYLVSDDNDILQQKKILGIE